MKTKQINIRKTVKTPSNALRYMVEGLIKQSKRDDFMIRMSTYGDDYLTMCVGCAATCALQQIANKNLIIGTAHSEDKRANYLGFNRQEMEAFEYDIDWARKGDLEEIFSFFGLKKEFDKYIPDIGFTYLNTWDWKEQLPEVRKVIALLESMGF